MTHLDQGGSFYDTCKHSYELVECFQNNTQPWGLIPPNKPGYKYDEKLRSEVHLKVTQTMQVLSSTLDRHNIDEISISYNGGKDCLVMLILVLASIYKKYYQSGLELIPKDYKLDAVYINSEDPFPEVASFIESSVKQYHLKYVVLKDSLQKGFETYLKQNPKIKTIIVGIRYSDPYGSSLKHEQVTDHNWPKFLRIHPILSWNYVHIWDFLLGCNLQYCSMYDKGYTSLGGVNNTVENPFLKTTNGFAPAYLLKDDADNKERLGRNKH